MVSDINITSINSSRSFGFDRGDISFVLVTTAMVFIMILGVAFLYAGLASRKSALTLMWAVIASNSITMLQWFLWGYTLAFSRTATNGLIGNLHYFAHFNVLGEPSPGSSLIPEFLYSAFQMEFACSTVVVIIGVIAERGKVIPVVIYTFFWVTFVYCPLAYWIWGMNGWALKFGALDFAGGGPVEIGSGVAGLAYAWILGPRQESGHRPHNVSLVVLGTFLLWFGWLGFNAGSAFGANLRAIVVVWNSMITAVLSGITWSLLDFRRTGRWSVVSLCSGTLAGLVAATPASGYIPPWSSLVMGIIAGGLCNYGTKVKLLFRIDDTFDIFSVHAIGGSIGLIFNGLFAQKSIIELDGVSTGALGGCLDGNWKQVYVQIIYICAVGFYALILSVALAKAIDMIPGLQLRSSLEDETLGMDEVQTGENILDFIGQISAAEKSRDPLDSGFNDCEKGDTHSRLSPVSTTMKYASYFVTFTTSAITWPFTTVGLMRR